MQEALPGWCYTDVDAWVRERERVLCAEWVAVGRLDDLGLVPGTGARRAVVEVLGESVLLTRDRAGVLHGFYNVCRHRGSQVVPVAPGEGVPACEAASLRCPYHSWTYGLDGALLRAPHVEAGDRDVRDGAASLDRAAFALHPVGVRTWLGFVLVRLDGPGAAPDDDADLDVVAERLAHYDIDSLVTGLVLSYDVRANYKVVLENYNECYHCGPVHPELCRLVPDFAGGGDHLTWEDGVPHVDGTWTFTTTGTTDRAPLPGLSGSERTRHKGELSYPNLLLSCSADHVAAFVVEPLAVDRTRLTCSLLFDRHEAARPGFDPSDAGDLWDLVNRQDWAVCESVQRGMSSRAFRQGWFAPMEDDSLDIRRWLLPRLGLRPDREEAP